MDSRLKKENLADRADERWHPPLIHVSHTAAGSLVGAARRFFDLQFGSIWRDMAALLPAIEGTVVDAGCGAQPFRSLLSPRAHYIGIDTLDAKEKFGYEIKDAVYFSGGRWPVESDSVDLVLCTETLEHVPDALPFLQEMRRCLKPSGQALLTVPFAARWHFVPHDYWRFTPSGLRLLLERAGFANIRVFGRGNELTVACYKVITLLLFFLMPQTKNLLLSLVRRTIGLLLFPFFFALAVGANVSLLFPGKDDCLGYTALADRGLGAGDEK